MATRRPLDQLIFIIPVLGALVVWLSALGFVPVPWPDDSAFYFVAKDFFHWPPRWVMLPQAPFEPSYAVFNFNTMPLYPILIGLGRIIGIDGPWAIKFWSLGFWALGGVILVVFLRRASMPRLPLFLIALAWALDPELRWSSVIVRPESLISALGVTLVCGLTLGWPKRWRTRGIWDPTAACLAIAAYAHFNAVHLLLPVIAASLIPFSREKALSLVRTGLRTLLYLSPWVFVILLQLPLYIQQMSVQWRRLAVGNDWLSSVPRAIDSLYQSMGSPEPWHPAFRGASVLLWIGIFVAFFILIAACIRALRQQLGRSVWIELVPSAAWVVGSVWLWHSKPEVWFVHYIHAALITFLALAMHVLARIPGSARTTLLASAGALVALSLVVNVAQLSELSRGDSWNWNAYDRFIDCIDLRLQQDARDQASPTPYRVWAPTFPDITIALSQRHPDWQFTRTCDFYDRHAAAQQHGRDVEAVVVAETLRWEERWINAPASDHPEMTSTWMTWDQHYLNALWNESGWKPTRHLCQVGRWTAYLYFN